MMESHGRHADFRKPRWGTTPLLSQTATGRWREANPGRANSKAAGDSRANPTSDLPDATSLNPQRPTAHIQVGDSTVVPIERQCQCRRCHSSSAAWAATPLAIAAVLLAMIAEFCAATAVLLAIAAVFRAVTAAWCAAAAADAAAA